MDKCRAIAVQTFSIFENVANFLTSGFHKTHKISLYNNYSELKAEHLLFIDDEVLFGAKTIDRFVPVDLCNPFYLSKESGSLEIWELITSQKTQLGLKIIESIEWSGKASIEVDDNKALLLYIIAIEAILNEQDESSLAKPITISLADSVAFLLGENKESRKTYISYMIHLYRLRSGIVHGSMRNKISSLDLHTAFTLSHKIIRTIITKDPYKNFKSKTELSNYLLKEKKYGE